jgi:hypothetical protein
MTRTILAGLATALLLSACASQPTDNSAEGQQVAPRGEATLGTLFPQKNKNRPANSSEADKQALENDRITNAGTNNSGFK